MKKIKILILIIICLNSFSYSQSQGKYFIKRGVKAETLLNTTFPYFFISDESSFITNNTLAGKIVYINFWFAACKPCMEEMPFINRLYERFKKDTNFVFISLTYNGEDVIQRIKNKFGIKYRVYTISPKELFRLNRTQSYPAHVIIDKNGIINSYFNGGFNAKFLEKVIYPNVYKLLNGG